MKSQFNTITLTVCVVLTVLFFNINAYGSTDISGYDENNRITNDTSFDSQVSDYSISVDANGGHNLLDNLTTVSAENSRTDLEDTWFS